MHPTIDEQLRGALRLLDGLDSTNAVSAEAREVLGNVGRLVRQARRSAAAAATFYQEDSQQMVELLASIDPSSGIAAPTPRNPGETPSAESQRNTDLRADLCRILDGMAADAPIRNDIGRYLLRRVGQDPT